MKIKSIFAIVASISEVDRHTAVNPGLVKTLIKDKKIRSHQIGKKGKKTVADFEQVIEDLNVLWGFNGNSSVPRIRSIRNAYLDLKEVQPELGISEETIRFLVKKNRLTNVKIGNRIYIALESFESPYVDRLFDEEYWRGKDEEKERIAQAKAKEAADRVRQKYSKTK